MEKAERILQEVKKAVVGKDDVLEKILMVILAKGHILLEDIPGVGKTTIAVAFSKAMSMESRRIQFTVDVLPSDVVGFSSIDVHTKEIVLHKGAVFCNIFLADEINRTSSKTQAALLEVMEEGSVTIDGYTQAVPQPFCVIATQNPFGSAGTQMLPESQLDRFMIRLHIGYPAADDEVTILKRKSAYDPLEDVKEVVDQQAVLQMQQEVEKVFVHEALIKYIVELVIATREHASIRQGASPRASISLLQLAKANAYLHERDYVVPRDIQQIFYDVIAHRILFLNDSTELNHQILEAILHAVEVPKG